MADLPGDIETIAKMQDGVLRNLFITQRYHDLSLALAETLSQPTDGHKPTNVNWSTFATWASKTAGQSIRNEEVPSFVVDVVNDAEDGIMHPLGVIGAAVHDVVATTGFHASFVLAPVVDTLKSVSSSIAAGNLKVFAELAPQFARFAGAFRGKPAPSDSELAAWIEPLDPAPMQSNGQGGQLWLRQAFTAYVYAMRSADPTEKARLALLGNCLIGLHEQTRLQPQIEEAMDAPIDVVLKEHLEASLTRGLPGGLFADVRRVIDKPLDQLTNIVEDVWERVATRFLMNLALPGGGSLPLGRNIPKEAAARAFLPATLQNITAPKDLVDLLAQYDRARGATDVGSASVDWRVLADRMNFIVNLFRSRQEDAELFTQPFTDAQRTAFESGQLPDGKL